MYIFAIQNADYRIYTISTSLQCLSSFVENTLAVEGTTGKHIVKSSKMEVSLRHTQSEDTTQSKTTNWTLYFIVNCFCKLFWCMATTEDFREQKTHPPHWDLCIFYGEITFFLLSNWFIVVVTLREANTWMRNVRAEMNHILSISIINLASLRIRIYLFVALFPLSLARALHFVVYRIYSSSNAGASAPFIPIHLPGRCFVCITHPAHISIGNSYFLYPTWWIHFHFVKRSWPIMCRLMVFAVVIHANIIGVDYYIDGTAFSLCASHSFSVFHVCRTRHTILVRTHRQRLCEQMCWANYARLTFIY